MRRAVEQLERSLGAGLHRALARRRGHAVAHLARPDPRGNRDHPAGPFLPASSALIEVGEIERAEGVIGLLEERARIPENVPVLAVSARCRGLLARPSRTWTGRPTRSATRWSSTTGQSCRSTRRERCSPSARCDAGAASGRPRRRRSSAPGRSSTSWGRRWTARAEAELRRVPIRRGAPQELTPTEEQVAELTGSGRTNREVAQALFMSPKTVEANLTRIYRKLGIRSRGELGARMAERRHEGAAPKP